MRERELEEKMHAFLRGDADVSSRRRSSSPGLDIPQANTLIVERADQLDSRSCTRSADASADPT
jgi:transcription-repair coupling factor (superfamily II helicase)